MRPGKLLQQRPISKLQIQRGNYLLLCMSDPVVANATESNVVGVRKHGTYHNQHSLGNVRLIALEEIQVLVPYAFDLVYGESVIVCAQNQTPWPRMEGVQEEAEMVGGIPIRGWRGAEIEGRCDLVLGDK